MLQRLLILTVCLFFLAGEASAQQTKSVSRNASKSIGRNSVAQKIPEEIGLRILRLEDERNLNHGELEKLLSDSNPAVRSRAALAIGRIGDKTGTSSLLTLLEKEPASSTKLMIVFALGEMEDSQAVPPLIEILNQKKADIDLRARTVEAIGKIASVPANTEKLGKETIEKLTSQIIPQLPSPTAKLSPSQKLLASLSITALIRLPHGPASVEALKAQLKSNDPEIRAEAAGALLRFPKLLAPAVQPLLATLADQNKLVRSNAARALGGGNDPSAIEPLRKLINDPFLEVQISVIRALGGLASLNDQRALEALILKGEQLIGKNPVDDPIATNTMLEIVAALENYKDARAKPFQQKLRAVIPEFNPASLQNKKIEPPKRPHDDAFYRQALRRAGKPLVAVIHTKRGAIKLMLFADEAPLTVDNFVSLAELGYFNGVVFHRVVPNFVIQGGDPTGTGEGGPGWKIRCEINLKRYGRGTLGMALSGKDTGGSQFFITHSPQPHLDGGYTIFGKVISGMDTVDRIARGDTIERISIAETTNRQR